MPSGIYPKEKRGGMFKKGHKGIKNSGNFKKGLMPWIAGKKHSEKSRKSMSLSHTGLKRSAETKKKIGDASRGEKNFNWKGGITSESQKIRHSVEIRLWRESVFARDGWKCQRCGDNKGGNLVGHHILNFAERIDLRTAIDNGITLCSRCHNKFHKKYTQFNNTQVQIDEFISIKGTLL
jgi:hypothetical protein